MKKLAVIYFVIISILFSGCGDGKETGKEVKSTECLGNNFFPGAHNVVEGEKGFYLLRQARYMSYAPKNNVKNETFLCGKPECTHYYGKDAGKLMGTMRENCNAGIENVIGDMKYYEGNIYILIHEMGEAVVYRISRDGSVHERIASLGTISGRNSGMYSYIVQGDYVYSLYCGETYKKDGTAELSRISIKSGNKEVLFECKEWSDSLILYNECLYFRKTDIETGADSTISVFDLDTGRAEDVAKGGISFYTIDNMNNALYYWKMEQGLIRHDLATGEEKLIRKSSDDMISAYLACNDKYIFVDNFSSMALTGNADRMFIEVIDLKTGEKVNTISGGYGVKMCSNEYLTATASAESGQPLVACVKLDNIADGNTPVWEISEYNGIPSGL